MESIDHTFNQARTDFNFICSKLSYQEEELPIVCETEVVPFVWTAKPSSISGFQPIV